MKDYKQITKDIGENVGQLGKLAPDVMAAFMNLGKAATKTAALDEKTKELIALAIGVACRCDGCIGYHMKALSRLKATREEVVETLAMCVYMGGGPSVMYAADALRAFEQFNQEA